MDYRHYTEGLQISISLPIFQLTSPFVGFSDMTSETIRFYHLPPTSCPAFPAMLPVSLTGSTTICPMTYVRNMEVNSLQDSNHLLIYTSDSYPKPL